MKVYAILMIFVMIFSMASFALAESGSSNNETDDSGNDSESDLDDSDEDTNETELDDDNDSNETDDDSDKNGTRERLRNEFREDRNELREEYRYEFRNATNKSDRYEFRNATNKSDRYEIRMKFREDGRELREEYKLKIIGENVSFNYTDDDKIEFMVGKINARTGLNLTVEDLENVSLGQVLRAYLSNGRWAEVKIMPDSASERALERLGAKCEERNCSIELKEVGKNGTNSTKLVYEVETEKESRMFWVFKNKMKVRAQVDAETGEVISSHKPWWAFLASEKDESNDDNDSDGNEDPNEDEQEDDSNDDNSNNQTMSNSTN